MPRKVIQPKTLNDLPPCYGQDILSSGGKLFFISGQVASDKDGNVVGKGDIEAQTRQVFDNLRAVLKTAGGTLDDLVMTTTYITGREYREGFHRVRSAQFKKTNTLVIVSGLSNPDYLIEISGIAVI